MALHKRAWDERILHVDMSPVLRGDDTIETVVSVTATALHSGATAVTISEIVREDRAVSFVCCRRLGGASLRDRDPYNRRHYSRSDD